MSGDGIYSRYLGRYSDPGRYRFTVSVDDNDNTAYYIEESNEVNKPPLSASNRTKINYADLYYTAESHRTCCGSTVQVDPDRRVKTGKSRQELRFWRLTVFHRWKLPVLVKRWLKAHLWTGYSEKYNDMCLFIWILRTASLMQAVNGMA